ncbi:hypothetical protein GC177_09350 [bacterium]|nr:hypothetical protein [bacterium]
MKHLISLFLLACLVSFPAMAADKQGKVTSAQQRCHSPLDCDYVDTSCSSCCDDEAIATSAKAAYLAEKAKRCKEPLKPSQPMCQCVNRGAPLMACVNNRCVLTYAPINKGKGPDTLKLR